MIFIIKGGTHQQKNTVVNSIAQLSDTPVFRRSVMNVPLLILKKSPSQRSQFISEVFNSYLGDALTINVETTAEDSRTSNPGNEHVSSSQNIEDIANDVKSIAKSLTTGVDPLFLFNIALKNVGKRNVRHHIFVDLQYKEELALLKEKVDDDVRLISLTRCEEKDMLLPNIEGLTPFEDKDVISLNPIEIPATSTLHAVSELLVATKLFQGNVVDVESKAEEVLAWHGLLHGEVPEQGQAAVEPMDIGEVVADLA